MCLLAPAEAGAQREDVVVASGFSAPTAMALAPDGRVFVAQQGGALRVVKNGMLLSAPFLTVGVTSSNERGLLGVTVDPGFASNRYVYVYYTTSSTPVRNRVIRYTASQSNPDVAESGSEYVVLDDIPSDTGWHNGGAIHFGPDGKLYVAVGEGHHEDNAQRLDTLSGKLLRVNADGSIPTDNPFYDTASGTNRAIWSLGLRNPFTFDIEGATGRIFINNVGENAYEEINEAWAGPNTGSNAGFNFGWPMCEGPYQTGWGTCTDLSLKYPFHHYPQTSSDCAITGGSFYDPQTINFPAEYVGDYFFADFCDGWIKHIDLTTKAVGTLLPTDRSRDPVDLKVAEDGSLYYLARGTSSLNRVRYAGAGEAPAIGSHPNDQTVTVGGSATFSVSAGGTQPLSYQWQRDGVNIPGATSASYTLSNAQLADDGADFGVVVTNAHGSATSNVATLTVTAHLPPTGTITAPAAGALYSGGDRIDWAGTASDPEDGSSLSGSRFTWWVDFHHEDHVHPFIAEQSGSRTGHFEIPREGEVSAEVWYRIHLRVRDSDGLTHTSHRDVLPRTADVTLAANVPGIRLVLDGQPVPAPHTFTGVQGMTRKLVAPAAQTIAGKTYEFVSWSDGGAASHSIDTPAGNATYTAGYREVLVPVGPIFAPALVAPDTEPPSVSALRMVRRTFAVGGRRTPLIARVRRGTAFRYTLSEPATVRIRIERRATGRRSGRACVRPRKRLRERPSCVRLLPVGTLVRRGQPAGPGSVGFSGRLRRRALPPGRYRAVVTAVDAAGNRSGARGIGFRIAAG
jgi:glucose/arabinose dehydrogenase